MRLSLEIGWAGVKGMQTNFYFSEDLMCPRRGEN